MESDSFQILLNGLFVLLFVFNGFLHLNTQKQIRILSRMLRERSKTTEEE